MNFKKTNKILSASLAGLLILPGCCQAKKVEVQENHKIADLKSSKAAEQNSFDGRIKKLLFWSSIIGGSMLAGGAINKYILQNDKYPVPTPLFTDAKKQLKMESTDYGYKIETPFATIALFNTLFTDGWGQQHSYLNMMFQLKPGALAVIHHNNNYLIPYISSVTQVYDRKNSYGRDQWEWNQTWAREILNALCGISLNDTKLSWNFGLERDNFFSLLLHAEKTFDGKKFNLSRPNPSNFMEYFLFALKFGLTDVSENLKYLKNRVEFLKSCAPDNYDFNNVEKKLDSRITSDVNKDTIEKLKLQIRDHKKELNSDEITDPATITYAMNNVVPSCYFIKNINDYDRLFYTLRATSAFNYILSDSARKTEITTIMKAYPERFNTLEADALCLHSDETALYKYLLDGKTIPKELEEKIKQK